MSHTAARHLGDEGGVASADVVYLDEIVGDEARDGAFAEQGADEHVQFDVLAQQVLVAHPARVDHPHAQIV